MTVRKPPSERPWTPWLLLAASLHALGWFLLRAPERAAPRLPASPVASEASVSVELDANELDANDVDNAVASRESASPEKGAAAPLPRLERGQRLSERVALEAPDKDAAGVRASGNEHEAASSASAEPSEAVEKPENGAGPRLSLQDLAIGSENQFALGDEARRPGAPKPAPRRASPREVGRMRFQKSMVAEIARAEQAVGLGPEGPALTQLEAAARTGNPSPNSNALFEFTTDSKGQLLSVELIESTSDPAPWRRIGRSTRDALGSTRLRLPKAGYGVTFRLRVVSRVQLPSGADPGLNVLSLGGDLADIGSPARRMVRAHLESLTVNDAKAADKL